jgi:hypothetical protein
VPDAQLITSSFALAYAGAVIDIERTGKAIGATMDGLTWDKAAVEDSRNTAVEWQVSPSTAETRELSSAGFEQAISLISEHRELIHDLADELMDKASLNEEELAKWYTTAVSKGTE